MGSILRGPKSGSLRRAARVAVAVSVAFYVGRYLVRDPQTSTFGALGAFGLLMLADFAGSRLVVARAYAAATAVALPLVALGTAFSTSTLWASVSLFFVAFSISVAAAIGRNVAGGSLGAMLFYIVACGIPTLPGAIPARLSGVAIGGTLALIVATFLWPERQARDFRRLLGDAALALGAAARVVSDGVSSRKSRQDALAFAKAKVDCAHPHRVGPSARPSASTAVDRAELHLVHGMERCCRILDRLVAMPPPSERMVSGERELCGELARVMQECGLALDGEGPAPSATAAFFAGGAFRVRSDATLMGELKQGDASHALAADIDRAVIAGELARTVNDMATDARVAVHADRRARKTDAGVAGIPVGLGTLRSFVLSAVHPDSVILRNSLRLAAALVVARAVAGVFDLERGFWVVFAVLGVMRTSAPQTGATALQAIAGTALGLAAATPLLVFVGSDTETWATMIPFVAFMCAYLRGFGVIATQAGSGILLAVLVSTATAIGLDIVVTRLLDVAVGVTVGVVVGLLAWPQGAGGQLAATVATALDRGGSYLVAALHWRLGPKDMAELGALSFEAQNAARRAQDVFTVMLSERRGPGDERHAWAELLALVHMLWHATDLFLANIPAPPPPGAALLVERLRVRINLLENQIFDAAAAMRAGRSPGDVGRPMPTSAFGPASSEFAGHAPVDDPWELRGTIDLLRTRALIAEVNLRVDEITESVSELAPSGHASRTRLSRSAGTPVTT